MLLVDVYLAGQPSRLTFPEAAPCDKFTGCLLIMTFLMQPMNFSVVLMPRENAVRMKQIY